MYPDLMYSYYEKSYSNAGKLVAQRQYTLNAGTTSYYTIGYLAYHYDESGKLKESEFIHDDGREGTHTSYHYFGDTLQTAIVVQPRPNGPDTYDSLVSTYIDQRLAREENYSLDDGVNRLVPHSFYTYEYDSENKLVKKYWVGGIPNVSYGVEPGLAEEYFYNDLGQLIESRRYDPYWGFDLIEMIKYRYF